MSWAVIAAVWGFGFLTAVGAVCLIAWADTSTGGEG